MRAYKFLDHRHRAPYSGFRWPVPGPGDEAGPWVETDGVVPCRAGIHACRPSDLAFWLNAELWEVELDGDVTEAPTKVVGRRGRLDRRVPEWAGGVARELIDAAAFRARDTAVAFCRHSSGWESAGPAAGAAVDALAECRVTAEFPSLARAAYRALPRGSAEQTAVGFVADAAAFLTAHVCHTPYVAACAAGHAASVRTGSRDDWEAAVHTERSWQSAWITDRLGLD